MSIWPLRRMWNTTDTLLACHWDTEDGREEDEDLVDCITLSFSLLHVVQIFLWFFSLEIDCIVASTPQLYLQKRPILKCDTHWRTRNVWFTCLRWWIDSHNYFWKTSSPFGWFSRIRPRWESREILRATLLSLIVNVLAAYFTMGNGCCL